MQHQRNVATGVAQPGTEHDLAVDEGGRRPGQGGDAPAGLARGADRCCSLEAGSADHDAHGHQQEDQLGH
ncbi:MAG: hypothetical protein O2816_11635, partial [Planctomycetota bacterium]|nr:hypothetical protein [Planctomycetota bacterium]